MSIYESQTKNKIKSSNVNIFCLEHFYTIRYDTFLHTLLCSTTYQKLVFYAGIPLIKFFLHCHKHRIQLKLFIFFLFKRLFLWIISVLIDLYYSPLFSFILHYYLMWKLKNKILYIISGIPFWSRDLMRTS